MKTFFKFFFTLLFFACSAKFSVAQGSRKEKQAAKIALIKKIVEAKDYVFKANYAIPQQGGTKVLTSEYDLTVLKDTLKAFLPYFGTAYLASPNVLDLGIKFSITEFDYNSKETKKGWEITIKSRNKNITDMRDVQQMRLDITPTGYASLTVISTNRDPISFDGTVEEK